MNNYSSGNAIVDAVNQINLQGDIIPHAWFKNIMLETGKPDFQAIHILGRIVYWYRPTVVFNEETGAIIGLKRKFKADLLQQSYEAFASFFGVSRRQVKMATDRLEKIGVIRKDFRDIQSANGGKLSNVLFIELNHEVLAVLSTLTPPTQNSNTLLQKSGGGSYKNQEEGLTNSCRTNTKNTNTKNSTKNLNTKNDFFENSKSKDSLATDSNTTLTDKQVNFFASKLTENTKFCSKHAEIGESNNRFIARLKLLLKRPEFVAENMSYLIEVGFVGGGV